MSEKNVEHLFDYGSINDQHKSAAAEIAELAEQAGNTDFAEMIRTKFEIKEIPRYDLTQSKMVRACAEAGIFCATQGFLQEGIGEDAIRYPLMAICEDVRTLEKLYDVIKNQK